MPAVPGAWRRPRPAAAQGGGPPGVLSFTGGIPDPALFPVEARKAAYSTLLGASTGGLHIPVAGLPAAAPWITRHRRLGCVRGRRHRRHLRLAARPGFLGRLLLAGRYRPRRCATYLVPCRRSRLQPRYDELRPKHGDRTAASYAMRPAARRRGRSSPTWCRTRQPDRRTLSLEARSPARSQRRARYPHRRTRPTPCWASKAGRCRRSWPGGEAARRRRNSRAVYCGAFSRCVARPARRLDRGAKALIRRLVLISGLRPQRRHHQPDRHAPLHRDRVRPPGDTRPDHCRSRRDWLPPPWTGIRLA